MNKNYGVDFDKLNNVLINTKKMSISKKKDRDKHKVFLFESKFYRTKYASCSWPPKKISLII